jgi:AcrR family transcriptional regulator
VQACAVCKNTYMQTHSLGLRERKRAETRDRLESAAVHLVLKNGIEHTTIDAICESADVSSRTFFNYFDSKEDAILGLEESEVTADDVDEVRAAHPRGDVVEITIALMFHVLSPSIASSKLFKSRVKIVKTNPQLLGRMANQMQRMGEQLADAIAPIVGGRSEFETENDLQPTAEVILSLCSGAARAAVKEWAASGNQAPIGAVEQRAVQLVRNTVERIK